MGILFLMVAKSIYRLEKSNWPRRNQPPILANATDKLTGFGSHTCVQHINEIVNFDKSKKNMFDKS